MLFATLGTPWLCNRFAIGESVGSQTLAAPSRMSGSLPSLQISVSAYRCALLRATIACLSRLSVSDSCFVQVYVGMSSISSDRSSRAGSASGFRDAAAALMCDFVLAVSILSVRLQIRSQWNHRENCAGGQHTPEIDFQQGRESRSPSLFRPSWLSLYRLHTLCGCLNNM